MIFGLYKPKTCNTYLSPTNHLEVGGDMCQSEQTPHVYRVLVYGWARLITLPLTFRKTALNCLHCTARYPLKGLPSERLFPLRVKVRQLRQLLMQQPDMEHLEHQASLPRPTYLCGRLRAFSLAHTWENALDGVLEQELVMSLGASAVVLLVVVCSLVANTMRKRSGALNWGL